MKKIHYLAIIMAFILFLAGCSSSGKKGQEASVPPASPQAITATSPGPESPVATSPTAGSEVSPSPKGGSSHGGRSPGEISLDAKGRAKVLINEGVDLRRQKKYDEARKKLDEAAAANSKQVEIYHEMARIHFETKNHKAAIEDYKFGIKNNPDDANLYSALFEAYMMQKDYQNALDALDNASRIDPKNTRFLMQRANLYRQKNNLSKAAELFEQTFETNRKQMDPLLEAARCYDTMKQDNKAKEVLDRAIKAFPDNHRPYQQLADLYVARSVTIKDPNASVQLWQKAADLYGKAISNYKGNDAFTKPALKFRQGEAYYKKWTFTKNSKDKELALRILFDFRSAYPSHPYSGPAEQFLKDLGAGN